MIPYANDLATSTSSFLFRLLQVPLVKDGRSKIDAKAEEVEIGKDGEGKTTA